MLVELLLAAVAIVLTAAILLSQLRGPPDSRAVQGDPPQGATARATSGGADSGPSALPPRAAGKLLEDPSFEAGLGRWQAGHGTSLLRVAGGRSGSWTASLAAAGSPEPSMGLRQVRRCQPGKKYAVTVWLRTSHPGALVRVDLAEESRGRRYAVDTAGAALRGQGWEPLQVIHVTHQPGATLAIEIAAVDLPTGGQVLVDDLTLEVATAPSRP
jgi:hypothetical protein